MTGSSSPAPGSVAAVNIYQGPLKAVRHGRPEMVFSFKKLTAWVRMELDSHCRVLSAGDGGRQEDMGRAEQSI